MAAPTGHHTPQPDRPPPERTNPNGLWWYSLALSVTVHAAVLLGAGWFYAHSPTARPHVGFRQGPSAAPAPTVFLRAAAVPPRPAAPARPAEPREPAPTPPPPPPKPAPATAGEQAPPPRREKVAFARPRPGAFASAVTAPEPRRQPPPEPKAERTPPAEAQPAANATASARPDQPPTTRPATAPADEFAPAEQAQASEPTGDAPPSRPDRPARASAGAPARAGVQSARPTRTIAPEYPPAAVRRAQQGRVTIGARVSAAGRVTSAEVLRSSGHALLDAAALRAVRSARFHPAARNGRPVASTVTVPIRFALRR